MYIARFDRNKVLWKVTILEKNWSDDILSNEIKKIKSKNFVFRTHAYKWISKEICRQLFERHELEVIDG